MTCVPLSTTVVYWTMNQSSQVVAATNRETDRQFLSFFLTLCLSHLYLSCCHLSPVLTSLFLWIVSSGRNKRYTNHANNYFTIRIMPTIIKTTTLNRQSKSLEDFVDAFLHRWLFTAGYSLSSNVDSCVDVQKGTKIDCNLGGLVFVVVNVDRKGGLIEYEMDPTTNLVGGPVLSSFKGEIEITEVDGDNDDDDDSEEEKTFDNEFRVVWKMDYKLTVLLNVLSCGVFLFSTKDMFKILLKSDLNRIQESISLPLVVETE